MDACPHLLLMLTHTPTAAHARTPHAHTPHAHTTTALTTHLQPNAGGAMQRVLTLYSGDKTVTLDGDLKVLYCQPGQVGTFFGKILPSNTYNKNTGILSILGI